MAGRSPFRFGFNVRIIQFPMFILYGFFPHVIAFFYDHMLLFCYKKMQTRLSCGSPGIDIYLFPLLFEHILLTIRYEMYALH